MSCKMHGAAPIVWLDGSSYCAKCAGVIPIVSEKRIHISDKKEAAKKEVVHGSYEWRQLSDDRLIRLFDYVELGPDIKLYGPAIKPQHAYRVLSIRPSNGFDTLLLAINDQAPVKVDSRNFRKLPDTDGFYVKTGLIVPQVFMSLPKEARYIMANGHGCFYWSNHRLVPDQLGNAVVFEDGFQPSTVTGGINGPDIKGRLFAHICKCDTPCRPWKESLIQRCINEKAAK